MFLKRLVRNYSWNPLLEQVWGTVSRLLHENILLVIRKAHSAAKC